MIAAIHPGALVLDGWQASLPPLGTGLVMFMASCAFHPRASTPTNSTKDRP